MREQIREKLRQRQGRHWQWASYAAGVAAVAALIFTLVEHKPNPVLRPALVLARLTPREIPRLETPQVRTAVARRRPARHRSAGIRSVDLIARADQPPLIRMTTLDPNVVILWQSNEGIRNE